MKKIYITLVFVWLMGSVFSQSVGIGTTTPDGSAVLDLSDSSRGLLIPRLTTAQREAIMNPADGLQIMNLDDYCVDIFDGTSWIKNCGFRITGMDTLPAEWQQRTAFGGGVRSGAVAFTIDNKAFVGTGYDGAYKKDFWEFDPATTVWTQKADFGGSARAEAVGFSIDVGIKPGYIGSGLNGSGYLGDFWEYNRINNSWTQKATLPVPRAFAVGFSIQGNGYIATGANTFGPLNDVFEYSVGGNIWVERNGLYEGFNTGLRDAVVFTHGGSIAYIGTGLFTHNIPFMPQGQTPFFWSFHLAGGGTWTQVANYPGGGRIDAVACGLMVGTGNQNGTLKDDIWEYTPGNNTWTQRASLPATARKNAVGFRVANKNFICGGNDGANLNDLWEYVPYPQGNIYENMPPAPAYSLNDGRWMKELDKMYSLNSGNIGIGTSNPLSKLDIAGNLKVNGRVQLDNALHNRKLVLYEGGNNDHQYYGLGINGGILRYQVSAPTDNHIFYAGSTNSASVELFRIKGNGNTGVNVSNPANRFDIHIGTSRTNTHPSELGLYVTANSLSNSGGVEFRHENATQGIGFGFNTIYATGSNADQHLHFASRGPNGALIFQTNAIERLRIQGNGDMALEGTILSEAFVAPTLLNGFVNYGGVHAAAAYYKDKLGQVHLRGLVNNAADPDNLVIFTLPAGYRPTTSGRLIFSAMNNDGICRVDVLPDGNVMVMSGASGWISLDQIHFRAD